MINYKLWMLVFNFIAPDTTILSIALKSAPQFRPVRLYVDAVTQQHKKSKFFGLLDEIIDEMKLEPPEREHTL